MIDIIIDAIVDMIIDTAKLLPFLFLAYLLIEFLEHKAGDKTKELVNRSGKWGPLLGSALGIVPQCGFSAATANLYAGGIITRGTLIAVFLSTSDEMLPILISNRAPFFLILKILAVKFLVGLIAGFAIDLVSNGAKREVKDICEQENCHCDEKGVFVSALTHTLKIAGFIALVTLVLNLIVSFTGEEQFAGSVLNKPIIGELVAGCVGLIPNCAASVLVTQLYLSGGMSAGAMLSGLLTSSGVGLLILFRMNRSLKDNLLTLALLYIIGVAGGMLAGLLPIF